MNSMSILQNQGAIQCCVIYSNVYLVMKSFKCKCFDTSRGKLRIRAPLRLLQTKTGHRLQDQEAVANLGDFIFSRVRNEL